MQISIWSSLLAEDRIVAVGLLTQREVELLGHGFSRLWPVDNTPCFSDLLRAIDEAEDQFKRSHEESLKAEGEFAKRTDRQPNPQPLPGGG